MLRGEIPLQVFNHRWALFLLGLFLAECTFRRAFSLPDTFIGRHLLWGLLLPLSLAWCRAVCHAALSLARHFVWTPAQGFWTDRATRSAVVSGWGRSAVITLAAGSPLR